jgi:hypothetical protein
MPRPKNEPRPKKEYRNPPFVETDVLAGEEVRRALGLSPRKWYDVAPSLPQSRALGDPRFIWGEVLKFIARTGGALRAS